MLSNARAGLKSIIPPAARQAARDRWENLRDWIDVFRLWARLARPGASRPRRLLYFGFAPGDDLLCTAVLRELRRRGQDGLMMISDHHELFDGNPDPDHVRPLWPRHYRDGSTVVICRRLARIWGGSFTRLEYAPSLDDDRRLVPRRHIIAELCTRAGIDGPVAIRPYLALSAQETSSAAWALGKAVIQSSGMAARHPMLNKQWLPDRYQDVIDALKNEVDFIQIGSLADPPLRHVNDLRGATSVRETAAILAQARLYIGTVGFPMHLARAVECPSVIIFGGREAPWQSGYICNLNLYSAVPCAPCWRSNTCGFDHRCMRDIQAEDVVSAIREMLVRPREPLAVETVEIT